jgi:hypothetical protein
MKNNNIQFWVIVIIIALIAGVIGSVVGAKISGNVINVTPTATGTEIYTKGEINQKLAELHVNDSKILDLALVDNVRIRRLENLSNITENSPVVYLDSLRKEGANVLITYAKNFKTNAYIYNEDRSNPGFSAGVYNTKETAIVSSTGFVVGRRYRLCHGNNLNICSQSVTLT